LVKGTQDRPGFEFHSATYGKDDELSTSVSLSVNRDIMPFTIALNAAMKCISVKEGDRESTLKTPLNPTLCPMHIGGCALS